MKKFTYEDEEFYCVECDDKSEFHEVKVMMCGVAEVMFELNNLTLRKPVVTSIRNPITYLVCNNCNTKEDVLNVLELIKETKYGGSKYRLKKSIE